MANLNMEARIHDVEAVVLESELLRAAILPLGPLYRIKRKKYRNSGQKTAFLALFLRLDRGSTPLSCIRRKTAENRINCSHAALDATAVGRQFQPNLPPNRRQFLPPLACKVLRVCQFRPSALNRARR